MNHEPVYEATWKSRVAVLTRCSCGDAWPCETIELRAVVDRVKKLKSSWALLALTMASNSDRDLVEAAVKSIHEALEGEKS